MELGLKALPHLLAGLPPKVGWLPAKSEAQIDRERAAHSTGRPWYHTAAWRRLRWQVLTESLFTCAMCGSTNGSRTDLLVCDHIRPHKGNHTLFWDRANLQCLCKACHDSTKQSEERRR